MGNIVVVVIWILVVCNLNKKRHWEKISFSFSNLNAVIVCVGSTLVNPFFVDVILSEIYVNFDS